MSGAGLRDDEVDRLLHEALPDDLPAALEEELRLDMHRAWRRAAAAPSPARWREWRGAWGRARPQPILAATALAMLAAGAAMQAAPAPARVVAALEGRQAASRTAASLARARAMQCTIEVEPSPGRTRLYRVEWETPGPTRVRFDGEDVSVARSLGAAETAPSLVVPRTAALPLSADVEPVRAYLAPAALAASLDGSRMAVTLDPATHLPLRLVGTDREGRKLTADCRWP